MRRGNAPRQHNAHVVAWQLRKMTLNRCWSLK